jgi:hypothetical protein
MLTLPGWAVLAFSDAWRQWRALQRWILAVSLSVAFYPVFFYSVRALFPFLTVGPYKMGALLLAFAVIVGWRMRKHWRGLFAFDHLEWVAIAVIGMTLFTRFWIIRDHPYPAWSDSLHHAILTHLTAVQGRLPATMEPYFPIPLGQYHLGLYSLTATVQWLAQTPAHTALLWTAQMLNGLCGVGVYLVLDRKVGRVGAVVGAVVVGLLSHQPAFYVNWGRFTQIAGQTLLLSAWLVSWEAIALWKRPWQTHRVSILWNTACAALLTGAVFLLHFRTAAFYIPLLAICVTWELWKARAENRTGSTLLGTAVCGVMSLIVVTPALWTFLHAYIARISHFFELSQTVISASEVSQTLQRYYEFPLHVVPALTARLWLIILAGMSAVFGLLRRNSLVLMSLIWISMLYLVGNSQLITNMTGVLIMLYLPIALIVGSAMEEVVNLSGPYWREQIGRSVIALSLASGFVGSHLRTTDLDPSRYFVTPEDVVAMDWIRENTPPDALFAVNTYFWLPYAPHGTDAGYWIPYFTGRQTTAGVMLLDLGSDEYFLGTVEISRKVEELELDNSSLAELQALGVDYVYVGSNGDFSGPGLDAARLSQAENVTLVFQYAQVSILQISPPARTD